MVLIDQGRKLRLYQTDDVEASKDQGREMAKAQVFDLEKLTDVYDRKRLTDPGRKIPPLIDVGRRLLRRLDGLLEERETTTTQFQGMELLTFSGNREKKEGRSGT
jgi:hypothetical protein